MLLGCAVLIAVLRDDDTVVGRQVVHAGGDQRLVGDMRLLASNCALRTRTILRLRSKGAVCFMAGFSRQKASYVTMQRCKRFYTQDAVEYPKFSTIFLK